MKYEIQPVVLHSEMDKVIRPNKTYKWTDIYSSVEELLLDIRSIDAEIGEDVINALAPHYKGCDFIHSFAKRLQAGQELTDKQITQAKRLAKEIKKATIVMKHVARYNDIPSKSIGEKVATMTNKEVLTWYRNLSCQINNHIQYIESYEQQQNARKRNDSISKDLSEIRQALKSRSRGICTLMGKRADIGLMYSHIINKVTPDDETLVLHPMAIQTCKELYEEDCVFAVRDDNNKIMWIPSEFEGNENIYRTFKDKDARIILNGWWFKGDIDEVKVYDGDVYIGKLGKLNDLKLMELLSFCSGNQRRNDIHIPDGYFDYLIDMHDEVGNYI